MRIIGKRSKKIDYVDPLIGTNGMGHTFPGACVPHGLVQLSPIPIRFRII
ncbi:MAG: hypothetical protein ACLU30_05710 [Odoribacter splanchnicus]